MFPTSTHNLQEAYIIFVDDDHDDCALIHSCFEDLNWHHHVKTVYDADALFDLLDNTPDKTLLPQLIVLDYHLPRLGGETALMLLKKDERYKHIPVALYSATMTEKKEKRLLRSGADLCRKKPARLNAMQQLLVELMEYAKMQHTHLRPIESFLLE